MIANYTCQCLPGYTGQHCENEINECESSPCHNGGQCTDLLAAYSCACTEDYAGPQCDILKQGKLKKPFVLKLTNKFYFKLLVIMDHAEVVRYALMDSVSYPYLNEKNNNY